MTRAAPSAWLMGIDIGAGSLKTLVVGSDGRVGGSASADIHTASPQPRWSEQDPADWWRALCTTVPPLPTAQTWLASLPHTLRRFLVVPLDTAVQALPSHFRITPERPTAQTLLASLPHTA